jgi:hypothetical protein
MNLYKKTITKVSVMFCHQDGIISREQSVPTMPSFVIKNSKKTLILKASLIRRFYVVKVALSDNPRSGYGDPRPCNV